jgi:hypothetical protein
MNNPRVILSERSESKDLLAFVQVSGRSFDSAQDHWDVHPNSYFLILNF